jgi:hypothetical protein
MQKRNPARIVRLALAIAALAVVPAGSAQADTSNDTSQLSVTGGSLAFKSAPDVPPLGTLTLNGKAQTLTKQMEPWAVEDATGTASGWNVTVQGESGEGKSAVFKEYCTSEEECGAVGYVGSGKTLAANSLTLSSSGGAFSGLNGTTGTAPTHSCGSACNVDSASPVKVASAAEDAGMGSWQGESYDVSSLSLSAPTTVKALGAGKVYRVDLLWTLSSGP